MIPVSYTHLYDTKKRKEEMVFPVYIEEAVSRVKGLLDKYFGCPGQSKWMALKLLEAVPEKGENPVSYTHLTAGMAERA